MANGASESAHPDVRIRWLWLAVGVLLAGRIRDSVWHATHDEFEGTSQQLEAHWLAWLGVILVLAVVAKGTTADARLPRGYVAVATGAALYVIVAIWHFIEHANGDDPEVAHVLLGVSQIAIFVGATLATFDARGERGGASSPGGGP